MSSLFVLFCPPYWQLLSPRTLRFDLLSEVLICCFSDWWEWSAAFYSPVPCLIEGLLRGGHGRMTHDLWSLSLHLRDVCRDQICCLGLG